MKFDDMKFARWTLDEARTILRQYHEWRENLTFEERFRDGKFIRPAGLDEAFIATRLRVSEDDAGLLKQELIANGLLDEEGLTPSSRGMALMNHKDRPRIPRAEGLALAEQVKLAADEWNAQPDVRIRVRRLFLFGSLLTDSPTIGDVDVIVDLAIPRDVASSEELDQQHEVCERLSAISEYISLTDPLDGAAWNSPKRLLYEFGKELCSDEYLPPPDAVT